MDLEPGNEGRNDATTRTRTNERTPLPKLQIFILFLVQFAEPVTATVIYPFINEFVRDTGITQGDEAKTGYYAGIIESIFFVSETLTVILWGRASDVFGRKPVLILGPLGLSFAMLGFGLSKSFWSLVYYRCLQGLFNGNIGVAKSVLAEITDKTNIGDAFALSPLMWNTGVTVGPIVGGLLARPAETWPGTLGKFALLRDYPYFLPCVTASGVALLSFAISAVSLNETLPSAKGKSIFSWVKRLLRLPDGKDHSSEPLLSSDSQVEYGTATPQSNARTTPKFRELFVPDMVYVLLNYGVFAFVEMANAALLPLIYSTPIEYGGLGLDPYHIGVFMASYGFLSGILHAFFLGPAIRHYGPRKVYSVCIATFLVSYCCFPIANALARQAGYIDWRVICVMIVQICSLFFKSPCYASMIIIVAQTIPSPELMGSANGVAQMVGSAMRSLAPAIATSLFAVSADNRLAGGYLVYIILSSLVLAGMRLARMLPTPSQSS